MTYWVNVYWYPKSRLLFYSSPIYDIHKAIKYSTMFWNNERKTLYRIKITMKE